MVKWALLLNMNKVLGSFGLVPFETDLSNLDKFLDVVKNLISSRNLFGKLSLVDHPSASEQRKYKHLSQQSWRCMHFYRVQGVKKLYFVKLEDKFSKDLFPQEGGLFTIVEENNSEEAIVLAAWYLRHEQLKVINVKLAIKQLLFTGWVLSPGHLAHVFLTADLASGPIVITVVIQNDLIVLGGCGKSEDLFERELVIITFEVLDLWLQIEGFFEEDFEGSSFGFSWEYELPSEFVMAEDHSVHLQSKYNTKNICQQLSIR